MTLDAARDTPEAPWTYEEALAFWFGCINYEQRVPCAAELKLEPMRTLLERQKAVKVKGSLPWVEALVFLSAPSIQCDMRDTAAYRVCLRDRDASPGQPFRATVDSMYVNQGRSTSYHLRLGAWGPVAAGSVEVPFPAPPPPHAAKTAMDVHPGQVPKQSEV